MDFEDLIGQDSILHTYTERKLSKTRMYQCLIRGIQCYINSLEYRGTDQPKILLKKWEQKLYDLESKNT